MPTKGPIDFKMTKFPQEIAELHAALCERFECAPAVDSAIENDIESPGNMYCMYSIHGVYIPANIKVTASLHYMGGNGKFGVNVSALKDTDNCSEWRRLAAATDRVFHNALNSVMEQLDKCLDPFIAEVTRDQKAK